MIISANPILKVLWKWQAKRRLNSDNPVTQYIALTILGDLIGRNQINLIFEKTDSPFQIVRTGAAFALRSCYLNIEESKEKAIQEELVISKFIATKSLREKITLLDVIRIFPLNIREELLGGLVKDTESDLRYSIIKSLENSAKHDILDAILESSETPDNVLRKAALTAWYRGIENEDFEDKVEYCGPRLHFLIRSSYELQTDGLLLKNILSYASKNDIPAPKAYPDFIIRYLTKLLGTWEYDPDAYRSLHSIVVPSYFTFDPQEGGDDRPFVIL